MGFQQVKRLVAVVFDYDLFNQLIYFLIDWFHLSQVKSTDWFGYQAVEFHNSLTINVLIFKREVTRPFFITKLFWKMCGFSLFRDHSDYNCWRLILDQFLVLLACVWSLEKVFVVGRVVLPLRFDLSQALCLCLVVF